MSLPVKFVNTAPIRLFQTFFEDRYFLNYRGWAPARHQMPDQRDQEQDQENDEEDLRDGDGAAGDSTETQCRRDDRDNEESDCPAEHGYISPKAARGLGREGGRAPTRDLKS